MNYRGIVIFFISFAFLFFFFNDSILFNEESLICFSLISIFYIIYKILHKSITLFFILDIEHLYLSFTYFLKINISLVNKLSVFLKSLLNLLALTSDVAISDLKHIYIKLLIKKSLKMEKCLLFADNTLNIRKDFWVKEGLKLLIKKNFIPSKVYNSLKLNSLLFFRLKNNKSVYERIFFCVQFLHLFYFWKFTYTLNKFNKLYKLC